MTIVCATDFSPLSDAACNVAAVLAKKAGERLVLVHAVAGSGDRDEAKSRLDKCAERLRKRGADVIARIESGDPHDAITRVAAETDARLIALAPASDVHRSLLGSTTDRTLSDAGVPVLAVREGFPAEEWIAGKRPLRISVAIDLSPISDAAAAWSATLRSFGAIELTALHVEWPVDAYERLGIEGPMTLDRTHPIVAELVRREIDTATEKMSRGGNRVEVLLEPPSSPPAEAISRMAAEARADLLVVGHRRSREWRIWQGSVARAVIRSAPMTVGCVPDVDLAVPVAAREIHTIVAATDLSQHGNAAVSYAFSIAPRGSRVFIVHVFDRAMNSPEERERVAAALKSFTAPDIQTKVEMIESDAAAKAIVEFADRVNADILCIAGRGRSRLPRLMLGSVAQELLLLSHRAVLVVP
jgi:nucleotide-binding universal stress UspA family protein